MFEETGLSEEQGELTDTGRTRTFVIDPRWRDRYAPVVTENREYEWRFRLASPLDIRLDTLEHSSFQWVSIDNAIDSVWSTTNIDALKLLREELRMSDQSV